MTLKQLKKRLNPVAQRFGYYTAYALDEKEYVGHLPIRTLTKVKELADYEEPPNIAGVQLSATKTHPKTGEVHDLTLRKVDPDNPRWQWHIHLWCMKFKIEVYSHYEMRPDFKKIDGEDKSEMIGRLKIHYRPEYGEDYYQGQADPVVQDLVND